MLWLHLIVHGKSEAIPLGFGVVEVTVEGRTGFGL